MGSPPDAVVRLARVAAIDCDEVLVEPCRDGFTARLRLRGAEVETLDYEMGFTGVDALGSLAVIINAIARGRVKQLQATETRLRDAVSAAWEQQETDADVRDAAQEALSSEWASGDPTTSRGHDLHAAYQQKFEVWNRSWDAYKKAMKKATAARAAWDAANDERVAAWEEVQAWRYEIPQGGDRG